MGLTLIEAPSEEPVSLEEAKLHCRIDGNDEDLLLTRLIASARRQAEHITGRALITQKWRLTLDGFDAGPIHLPKPRLQSVESLSYVDPDGVSYTLDASDYRVTNDSTIGCVLPAYGAAWPQSRRAPGAVTVVFTAGYGAAPSVPEDVKSWILLAVGAWYAQRESTASGSVSELPRSAWQALLEPYVATVRVA